MKKESWAATKGERIARGLAEAAEVGECLEWQGPFGGGRKKNTAIVKARDPQKGRTENFAIARELWEAAYGPIEDGKLVYRKCCNNACVLLDHLTIGTRLDWAKTRKKAGVTKHHQSTVIAITVAARRRGVNTAEKASAVRQLTAEGLRINDIAERTGVSKAMVEDIRGGRAWAAMVNPFSGLGAR